MGERQQSFSCQEQGVIRNKFNKGLSYCVACVGVCHSIIATKETVIRLDLCDGLIYFLYRLHCLFLCCVCLLLHLLLSGLNVRLKGERLVNKKITVVGGIWFAPSKSSRNRSPLPMLRPSWITNIKCQWQTLATEPVQPVHESVESRSLSLGNFRTGNGRDILKVSYIYEFPRNQASGYWFISSYFSF